ncbi:MAG TPA: MTH1187 family thiamine-binding protein [Bacillota bacterium]|nr:MTH1187 family thiamine-binding protein [Bacillota bacterium]
MPQCNVSLQVIPLVEEAAVYPTVDRVIELIKKSGVKYTVGPMETTMEGELDRLLDLVKEAQQVCAAAGAERILSVVKIDYSTKGVTIDEKVGKYRQA